MLERAFAAHPDAALAFPGSSGRPLSDMALNAVMRRMGADGVPHGFRSSFRDRCAEDAVNRELAERSLAHSVSNQTKAAYHRTDQLEQRRPVMKVWAAFATGKLSKGAITFSVGRLGLFFRPKSRMKRSPPVVRLARFQFP